MTAIPALRQDARQIFQAGVQAADPYLAVKRHLHFSEGQLKISLPNGGYRSGHWRSIYLIAFGKAACGMAKAALEIIPPDLLNPNSIVVTHYANVTPLANLQVIGAGHPLPDDQGYSAALQLAERVKKARPGDLVLVLVSGGGSALIPYPAPPITLAEKIVVTDLLLACGATINQINCVRKHLSVLKGGGLARLAAAADLHALILSDVLGDDLASIASGPTVPDSSTFTDAVVILRQFHIWEKLPASVKRHLAQGQSGLIPETPKPGDPIFRSTDHTLIGSNAISIDAMLDCAQGLGYGVELYGRDFCGEARIAADQLAGYVKRPDKPVALLAGGETTVTLKGTGLGGRNQELALAFALAAETHHLAGSWVFLSGGTDGRDGPTDAAGGLVDAGSLVRIRQAGLEPLALLHHNDSYHALLASHDLLLTGATGTNVADLQILLLSP